MQFSGAVEVLPVEIVEAEPLTIFSERANAWPIETVYSDYTIADQSLYDSISKFSGVVSRGDLSGGSPNFSIRGSSEYGRTLLLYNGTPLNLMDGLGASSLLIPQETTHSTFVLKGASSVLYGSDAIGGAINIIPHTYDRAVVRGGLGSFGRKSIYGAHPILKSENHKLQITGFSNSIDGDFPYKYNSQEQEREPNGFHLQRFTITGQHKVSSYTVKETLIYGQSFGGTPGPVDLPYPTHYDRTSLLGSLLLEKNVSARGLLSFRSTGIFNEFFNTDASGKTRWYSSQIAESVSYKNAFSDQHSAEFFIDYMHDEFENKPNTTKRLVNNRVEPGIIFKYSPDQNYFLSPGIRYLPSEGLLIKSLIAGQDRPGMKTWISYSEGYRNPSFSQKFFQSPLFNGNPSLKPEKSDQIEIGFGKKGSLSSANLLQRLGLEAAVYSTQYRDFIQYDGGSPGSYFNASDVNFWGADLSVGLNYQIWSTKISYSHIQPDITLTLMPKQKFSLVFGAQLGPVIAEVVQTHWDRYMLTQTKATGAWDVFDLNFRTIGLSDWTAKISVQNIFDNSRTFTSGYPEPGRQFITSLERFF